MLIFSSGVPIFILTPATESVTAPRQINPPKQTDNTNNLKLFFDIFSSFFFHQMGFYLIGPTINSSAINPSATPKNSLLLRKDAIQIPATFGLGITLPGCLKTFLGRHSRESGSPEHIKKTGFLLR
jgi:hypothetical protein